MPRPEPPRGVNEGDAVAGLGPADTEWIDVFSFNDRHATAGRAEDRAIFGGIQLAAKMRVPTGGIAQRRKARGRALRNREVDAALEVGNRDIIAGEPPEELKARRRSEERGVAVLVGP